MPADVEGRPSLTGKVEHEALEFNHGFVGNGFAKVIFPCEGLDRAGVAALTVRCEDKGLSFQVD